MRKTWLALLAALAAAASIQTLTAQARSDSTAEGRQIYAQTCSGCHGLDGRGTQRAPNIAGEHALQLSENDVLDIISKGIPERGMPAFQSLGTSKVSSIVAYVRQLQGFGATAVMPGNPDQGKKLFFGKAGCSKCHMVNGAGGFIAPDLSSYAQAKNATQISEAITNPDARESRLQAVTVTSGDGRSYEGILRSEDNFSLQLQSMDGAFHLFSKANIKSIDRKAESIMPAEYGETLTGDQIKDLVSYLLSVGRNASTPAEKQGPGTE